MTKRFCAFIYFPLNLYQENKSAELPQILIKVKVKVNEQDWIGALRHRQEPAFSLGRTDHARTYGLSTLRPCSNTQSQSVE